MSNFPSILLDAPSLSPQPAISPREKRLRWFELALVLLIALSASLLNSLYLLHYGPSAAPHISSARWLAGLGHEAISLLLLGYVLSRRNLGFKDIGLRWSLKDAGVGFLVAGVSYAAYVIGALVVQLVHYAVYHSFANGPDGAAFFAHPGIASVPFVLLNPFFEELIVRAYVMTEVLDLTGSSLLAVALSVGIQFSYHLYYGWPGAVALAFQFLIFAIYYSRSRRALPVVVAHAFFDISATIHLW
jgi:membrane protease YdiL (CAAX protease family)